MMRVITLFILLVTTLALSGQKTFERVISLSDGSPGGISGQTESVIDFISGGENTVRMIRYYHADANGPDPFGNKLVDYNVNDTNNAKGIEFPIQTFGAFFEQLIYPDSSYPVVMAAEFSSGRTYIYTNHSFQTYQKPNQSEAYYWLPYRLIGAVNVEEVNGKLYGLYSTKIDSLNWYFVSRDSLTLCEIDLEKKQLKPLVNLVMPKHINNAGHFFITTDIIKFYTDSLCMRFDRHTGAFLDSIPFTAFSEDGFNTRYIKLQGKFEKGEIINFSGSQAYMVTGFDSLGGVAHKDTFYYPDAPQGFTLQLVANKRTSDEGMVIVYKAYSSALDSTFYKLTRYNSTNNKVFTGNFHPYMDRIKILAVCEIPNGGGYYIGGSKETEYGYYQQIVTRPYLARLTVNGTFGISDAEQIASVVLAPNNSSNYIRVQGLSETSVLSYKIISETGMPVKEATLRAVDKIGITDLRNGIYYLQITRIDSRAIDNKVLKFVKY